MLDTNKYICTGTIKKTPVLSMTKTGTAMTIVNFEIQNERSKTWFDFFAFDKLAEQLTACEAGCRLKIEAYGTSRKNAKTGRWEIVMTISNFAVIEADVKTVA